MTIAMMAKVEVFVNSMSRFMFSILSKVSMSFSVKGSFQEGSVHAWWRQGLRFGFEVLP